MTSEVQTGRASSATDPVALVMAAMAAQEAGRTDEALTGFEQAVRLAPLLLDLRLMLSYAQGSAGKRDEARRTLDAAPGISAMSGNDARRLADAACAIGADSAALHALDRALAFAPHDPDLHAARGAVLHRRGRVRESRELLQSCVRRWPKHVTSLMNLARLEGESGGYHDAIALYDRVLKLDASHARARANRGLLRLLVGDYEQGWRDYEARRSLELHTVAVPPALASWDGKVAEGRTLLLWGEQGLGDQLMMVRYASQLAERGARVVVRCHPALASVLHTVRGVHAVLADDLDASAFAEAVASMRIDAHVPMFSAPQLLHLHDPAARGGAPYLDIDRADRSHPNGTRRTNGTPRIAVVWAGSASHGNDHNRSVPRERLAQLLELPVEWVSLQLGPRRDDLASLPPETRARITDVSESLHDFMSSARTLRDCDALLTVDTSVAHLAGAMGVPTTILVPAVPDWRWGLEGSTTAWYDSVRLARQSSAGDWESAIGIAHRQILPLSGTAFRDS